ncbi:hypothetical protein DsansV1_C05g0050941 [Dioscorea sansibarensis]
MYVYGSDHRSYEMMCATAANNPLVPYNQNQSSNVLSFSSTAKLNQNFQNLGRLTEDLIGGEPTGSIPGEHPANEILGCRRHRREDPPGEPEIPPHYSLEDLRRCLAVEWWNPTQHQVQYHPRAPYVHLLPVLPPLYHLRRNVVWRTHNPTHRHSLPEALGRAEVHKPEPPKRVKHHVVRLHIPVSDPTLMASI